MINKKQIRTVKSKSGALVNVTSQGSLGLLALGDIGLYLWREQSQKQTTKINNREVRN